MSRRCKRDINKKQKRSLSCKESLHERENCIVCFEQVSCRGKLGVCDHWFCFECIHEWSKNTNTCPVCKKKFRCITKTHLSPGKSPLHKIRVQDVDQRVWNDDDPVDVEEMLSSSGNSSISSQVEYGFNDESQSRTTYDLDDSFIVCDSESEDDVLYVSDTSSSDDDDMWHLLSSGSSSSSDWLLGDSPGNNIHDKKETNLNRVTITVNLNCSDDSDNGEPHVRQTSRASTTAVGFYRKANTLKVSSQRFQEAATRTESTSSRKKDVRRELEDIPSEQAAASSSSSRRNTRQTNNNNQSTTTRTSGTAGRWLNATRDRASRETNRQEPKQKPRSTRNEKPTTQTRSVIRTRRVTRTHRASRDQSNDVTAPTNTVQRNQRSQNAPPKTRRHTKRVNTFVWDSDNSDRKTTTDDSDDQRVVSRKTQSGERLAVLQSPPEETPVRNPKRRRVLKERQNNEFK